MRRSFSAATALDQRGEYRRELAPRSALSLTKIPRRTQTASSGNIVWEWKLCWAIDPAPFCDGSSGSGPQRALERHHPDPPRAFSAKAQPLPTFPASAGPIPRSPRALTPGRQPPQATRRLYYRVSPFV